jgi:hypothetical protein
MEVDRRSALLLGAAVTAAAAFAPSASHAQRRSGPPINPVLFWHDVGLELVALDHSIDPADARAPGPCASALALGIACAVIADAVSIAYHAPYRPYFLRGEVDFEIESPELFVGGAAAGIFAHIFNSPIHAYRIAASRDAYQRLAGGHDGKDWQAGLAFSSAPEFQSLWRWDDMSPLLMPQFSNYIPRPRQHNIDPFNAGQGSYGAGWGHYRPLVLDGPREVAALAPEPPPPEGSPEYERDLAEVRVKGALISKGDGLIPARTGWETQIGLFWAYDGARLIGTPPRLYNQILRKIAIDDDLGIVEMARLFALCNIAMADASIVAWWTKYKYNVWRPVLGIQNHRRDPVHDWQPLGSPRTNPPRFSLGLDAQICNTAQSLMGGGASILAWQLRMKDGLKTAQTLAHQPSYRDAAFTPNFPAYPSGHATFGAACFQMLKFVRRERPQTRRDPDRIGGPFISEELNGISIDHFRNEPRPFAPFDYDSIERLIEDNDLSRVYLGVHWRFDCRNGSHSGRRIAKAVYERAYEYERQG